MDFRNKVAFVTGGASGIGFAIASALAQRGARIALADIQADPLEAAGSAIRQMGADVLTVTLDVTDRAAVYAAVARVDEQFGGLDIVINNAGIGDAGNPLDTLEDEFFDWLVHVNLFGVMNVMKAAIPRMKARGNGGHILNTSSMAGLVVVEGWNQGLYSATKMAVLALSLDMRTALAPHGVGVSAFCPGVVATNITANAIALRPSALSGEIPDFPEMLTTGGMSADTAAQFALRGIEQDMAIIITNPELWPSVAEFHAKIRAGFETVDAQALATG